MGFYGNIINTNDFIKKTTTFTYTPEVKDGNGNILTEEVKLTIAELVAKVKQLEERIIELEKK